MFDECDPGQKERECVGEGEDEEKEVEQRVPAITRSREGPRVPVTKKKYQGMLLYVRGFSE